MVYFALEEIKDWLKMPSKPKLKINRNSPQIDTFPIIYHKLLLFTLITLFLTGIGSTAYGLPQVERIDEGDIEINYPNPQTMEIKATDNTIIKYTSFNIHTNESLIVNLPSNESRILNRVTGTERSSLLGNLDCNGIFFLVNTHGIYVGEGATINTQSLILSTRDIENQDFLNKDYLFKRFSQEDLDTLLINKGMINVTDGGFGVLIAGAIENQGKVVAKLGTIALLAGD